MKAENLIGKCFGRLRVLSRKENYPDGKARWECLCLCGGKVTTSTNQLKSGKTRSCGCLRKETITKRNTKHGLRRSRAYLTWQNMMKRCYNKKCSGFKNYGGRGISVCEAWHDFYTWFQAVGPCPKAGCSLDRIDNAGDYAPGNVRWATREEQAQNMRTTKLSPETVQDIRKWRGRGVTLCTLAEDYGVSISTIHRIEKRLSWENIP